MSHQKTPNPYLVADLRRVEEALSDVPDGWEVLPSGAIAALKHLQEVLMRKLGPPEVQAMMEALEAVVERQEEVLRAVSQIQHVLMRPSLGRRLAARVRGWLGRAQ